MPESSDKPTRKVTRRRTRTVEAERSNDGRARPIAATHGRLSGRRPRGKRTLAWLELLRDLAVLVITALFGLGVLFTEISAIAADPGSSAHHILAIVRIVGIFVLLLAWYIGSGLELAAFNDLLEQDWHLMPEMPSSSAYLVLLAALALAGMALLYWSAALFALCFVGLKTTELLSSSIISGKVRAATEAASKEYSADPTESKAIEVLAGYYLKRPWVPLAAIGLLLASCAASVAAYAAATTDSWLGLLATTGSSVGMLMVIVAQEVVTYRWRLRFKAGLDEVLE